MAFGITIWYKYIKFLEICPKIQDDILCKTGRRLEMICGESE